MQSGLRLFLLLPLTAVLACGGASSTPTGGYAPPTGGYVLTVSPAATSASTFTGALTVVGTTASGVFQFNNPGTLCVSGSQDIPFSGTISNSVLTLTSGAFSGSIATLKINLPLSITTAGTTTASGTAVITGGTCALALSPMSAALVPSYNGTWTGVLTGPVSGTVSIGVVQSAANSDGQFPTTASVAFTAPTCSFSVAGVSGLISGYNIQLGGTGTTAPNNQLSISAGTASTPVTLNMSILSGLICPNGTYTGPVTHQ